MNRIERIATNEAYRQAAADCIQRRHPEAAWLAAKRPEDMNTTTICEVLRRLRAWLSEHPAEPPHPDSYRARHGA